MLTSTKRNWNFCNQPHREGYLFAIVVYMINEAKPASTMQNHACKDNVDNDFSDHAANVKAAPVSSN